MIIGCFAFLLFFTIYLFFYMNCASSLVSLPKIIKLLLNYLSAWYIRSCHYRVSTCHRIRSHRFPRPIFKSWPSIWSKSLSIRANRWFCSNICRNRTLFHNLGFWGFIRSTRCWKWFILNRWFFIWRSCIMRGIVVIVYVSIFWASLI